MQRGGDNIITPFILKFLFVLVFSPATGPRFGTDPVLVNEAFYCSLRSNVRRVAVEAGIPFCLGLVRVHTNPVIPYLREPDTISRSSAPASTNFSIGFSLPPCSASEVTRTQSLKGTNHRIWHVNRPAWTLPSALPPVTGPNLRQGIGVRGYAFAPVCIYHVATGKGPAREEMGVSAGRVRAKGEN